MLLLMEAIAALGLVLLLLALIALSISIVVWILDMLDNWW